MALQRLLAAETPREIPSFSEVFKTSTTDELFQVFRKMSPNPAAFGEGGAWDSDTYQKEKHANSPLGKLPFGSRNTPDWDSLRKREFSVTGSTFRTDRLKYQQEQASKPNPQQEKKIDEILAMFDQTFSDAVQKVEAFNETLDSIDQDMEDRRNQAEQRLRYYLTYPGVVYDTDLTPFEFVSYDGKTRYSRPLLEKGKTWKMPPGHGIPATPGVTPELLKDAQENWTIERITE